MGPLLFLLGLTLLWLLLPLLPALLELFRPRDTKPLEVSDRSVGKVSYFARNFRHYLDRVLPPEAGAGDYAAKLLDGTEFVRVNRRADQLAQQGKTENRVVVLDAPQRLPGDQTYTMEVYARAALASGAETNYRAVYGEQDLELGERNRVFRWAHAGGTLSVGPHSILRGRASANQRVMLDRDVVFERAGAPVIACREAREPPPVKRQGLRSWNPPPGSRAIGDHVRVEGDLELPRETLVTGSLVVTGRLRIGAGTLVEGSVKAHGDLDLADRARVAGAAITRGRLALGEAAWVGGPAVAERAVRLGPNAVVGGPSLPASVCGLEVELGDGATVYGQISALRGARTL